MASRVEMIFSAEDAAVLRSAQRMLEAARQVGDGYDRNINRGAKSGQSAFDKLGASVLRTIGPASIAALGVKALQSQFEELQQSAAAINAEAARASTVGQGLGANIANFAANRPGGVEDAAALELAIAEILADPSVALEDGANRLGAAATAVQSSLPEADLSAIVDTLRQTAETGTLAPGADLSGIATALAKLQDLGGLSGDQAQQFARQAQVASQVGDSAAFAESITPILSLAEAQGIRFEEALGLFGFATKQIGDSRGSQASTAVLGILNRLASGSEKAERFGLEFESDNAFGRLVESARFLRDATEQQRGQFRSAFAEGTAGGTIATRLATDEGLAALGADIRLVASADLRRDSVREEIGALREASPSFSEAFNRLQATSELESQRLGDVQAGEAAGTLRQVLTEALQRARFGEREQQVVLQGFDLQRTAGTGVSESLELALRNLAGRDQVGAAFLDSVTPDFLTRGRQGGFADDGSQFTAPFADVAAGSESLQRLIPILERLSATQDILAGILSEQNEQNTEANEDRRRTRRVVEDRSTPNRALRQGVDAFGGGR